MRDQELAMKLANFSKFAKSDYFVPVLYFAGAAGGLAYGAYALVGHLRDQRPGTSAGAIAKIGAPILIGSGLAVLGARDLRAGRSLVQELWEGSTAEPRPLRKLARARRRVRAARAIRAVRAAREAPMA
jgi:hypothetical protein